MRPNNQRQADLALDEFFNESQFQAAPGGNQIKMRFINP
jgi:hypothetical protein